MDMTLATRAIVAGVFGVAIASLANLMLHFLRRPQLAQAKVFLNYDRFSKRFLVLVGFAFAAELATYLYTIAGSLREEYFASWPAFFQHQTIAMSVAVFIGTGLLGLRRMLK